MSLRDLPVSSSPAQGLYTWSTTSGFKYLFVYCVFIWIIWIGVPWKTCGGGVRGQLCGSGFFLSTNFMCVLRILNSQVARPVWQDPSVHQASSLVSMSHFGHEFRESNPGFHVGQLGHALSPESWCWFLKCAFLFSFFLSFKHWSYCVALDDLKLTAILS